MKAHLPPSVGQHEETERYGCSGHGVCGGHAVLRVVEDLHLHHWRGRRSGPTHHVFGRLSHEQVPGPDHDEPPTDQRVDVPEEKREEDDEEHLVAQLGPEGEQVEEELVVDQELLTHVSGQRVSPEGHCLDGVWVDICCR